MRCLVLTSLNVARLELLVGCYMDSKVRSLVAWPLLQP